MLDFLCPCSILSKTFQAEDMLVYNVPKALNKCVASLEKLKGGNGHFMIQFAKHYNPTNNTFKGIQLGIRLGRITRQVHIDEVFQGDQEAAVLAQIDEQLDEDYEDLDVLEDDEDEFSESDSNASAADSDAQSSSSSECKQILQ